MTGWVVVARRLSALCLLACALLSACGGGDSSSSTQATPPGSASAREGGAGESEGGAGEAEGAGAQRSHYEGGEESVERFGSGAQGGDREAVLAAEHEYLAALVAGDYAQACAELSEATIRSLVGLAPPPVRSRGCGYILPKLLSSSVGETARAQLAGQVTQVRLKGDRAFVLFHAPGAKLYLFSLVREKGNWRMAAISSSVLVPSAATLGETR